MKQKKTVLTEEISDDKLQELFDRCNGRRSNYLILNDEPQNFIDLLKKEGWVIPLANSENRPWFTASMNLITKFRDLDATERKQQENIVAAEKDEAEREAEEESRASEAIEAQQAISLAPEEPVRGRGSSDLKGNAVMKAKPIQGPDEIYDSTAKAARANGVSPSVIRDRVKDENNKQWTYFEE
jgi:hypothetical protein